MAREIELKLTVLTDDTGRVFDLPVLTYSVEHRLFDLETTYYDTPDCKLAEQGIALRIRNSDEGWVQTVKTQGRSEQGLHERDEYSVVLDKPIIDLSKVAHEELQEQLTEVVKQHEIAPVFVTHFSRSAWMLNVDDSTRVELVFDQGEVRVGNQSSPILEIELELVQGKAIEVLYQLAGTIAESLPIGIDMHSKAWKGYQLYQAVRMGGNFQPPETERLDAAFFYEQSALLQE